VRWHVYATVPVMTLSDLSGDGRAVAERRIVLVWTSTEWSIARIAVAARTLANGPARPPHQRFPPPRTGGPGTVAAGGQDQLRP
jgi:hypothetical protein